MAYIEFKSVCKEYKTSNVREKALKKVSFEIEDGEFVIITGPSGAGKTTIFNILNGTTYLTSGDVLIDGVKINDLKSKELTKYKRENVGLVFEKDNLIENLTAKENIELSSFSSKNNIEWLLKKFSLTNKMDNFPSQLSKKEAQKVAIARAFFKDPKFLLCDEPTGALDSKASKQIFKLLKDVAKNQKKTVIITTHNSNIAPIADKVITIKDGYLESVKTNKKPLSVGDLKW